MLLLLLWRFRSFLGLERAELVSHVGPRQAEFIFAVARKEILVMDGLAHRPMAIPIQPLGSATLAVEGMNGGRGGGEGRERVSPTARWL